MTAPPKYDAGDVKGAALSRLQLVAETVLGTIRKPGKREWRWAGHSCALGTVTMNANSGMWHAKESGQGGDVVALWAAHMGLPDTMGANFGAVLASLGDFLGVDPVAGAVDPAQRTRQRAVIQLAQEERADAAQVAMEREEAQRAAILSDMRAGVVPVAGTPAETYLRSRGITAAMPAPFAGFLPAGTLGAYRKGLVQSDAAALVIWARDAAGEVVGAQRILLTDDGRKRLVEVDDGKAAKFTTGRGDGARIALPRVDPFAGSGALLIGEGPETAAAIWQATGADTWAVLGSSGWAGLVDLLPRDRRVILAPDADAMGSQAWQAFNRALVALVAAGVDVRVAETPARYGPKADLGDVLVRDGDDGVRAVVAGAVRATPEYLAKRGNLARLKGSFIGTEAPRVEVDFLPVVEASARVMGAVEALFSDARCWHHRRAGQDDKAAPVHVLKATAGLGKSRAVREAINAELARGVPDDQAVYVFVPTLDLADEAQQAFAIEYPFVPSMVFRGRSAKEPGAGATVPGGRATMCVQPDLAREVSASGLSVRPHLCEGKGGTAWCRSGCSYLAQLERPARVVFLSHQFLNLGIPDGMPPAWAVVIDENFERAGSTRITSEMMGEVPTFDFEDDDDPAALRMTARRMKNAGAAVGYALARGEDMVSALKASGFGVEDAQQFAKLERRAAKEYGQSKIDPTMTEGNIRAILESRANNPARDSTKRARLWRMMAARWGDGGGQRIVTRDEDDREGGKRRVVRLFHRPAIRIKAPALLIDADACPVVTAAAYPGRAFSRVDVRLRARVTQITDSAISKHKLLRADGCEGRRRAFGLIVSREVTRAGGDDVLAVASKAVAHALLRDEAPGLTDEEIDAGAKAGGLRYRGAHLAWFGPSTRGVDRWKDCGTVVILGNRTPPVGAIEDKARALFGDDLAPLDLIGGAGMFPTRQEGIATRSGERVSVEVRHHPDARADALLRQFREQSTIQAIARIRAIHCADEKRIVILSNVPLEGVEVDCLTTWADFAPDRMEAAILERSDACTARGVPFGLRASDKGLSDDAPGEFPTPDAARAWRRRSASRGVTSLIGTIMGTTPLDAMGTTPLAKICEVALRLHGQSGSAISAVIVCNPSDAKAAAALIWGPVASCKVVAVHGGEPAPPPDAIDAAVDLAIRAGAANLAPMASAIVTDGAAIFARGGDACAVIRKAAGDTGHDFGAACLALNLSCEIEKGTVA